MGAFRVSGATGNSCRPIYSLSSGGMIGVAAYHLIQGRERFLGLIQIRQDSGESNHGVSGDKASGRPRGKP